jgi:glycosyltransferase involved in cell wall biosynthesis
MAARNMPIDGVHVHDFDTLPVGYCLSRLRGVPLIYDAHEHYSRMVAIDVPMIVTRLIDRLELMLVAKSDLVITVCPDLASRYEGLKGPDVVIVTNCVDLPPLEMVKAPVPHQEVILFYGGTLEPMRYIEETIEAVRNAENVKLILAGNGRLSQMISREAASSPNLEYLGYLEWNALMRVMATADAVLCLLDPRNENYRIAIANRLCEGMAYGVPVIASRGTLSGEIVQAEGAGIVIEWSPENLLAAIDELRDSQKCMAFGRNGRAAAQREYNWDIMKARLLDAYQKILGSH